MDKRFSIHPTIGVARVGNSADGFYLGPETTGGLGFECDRHGNPLTDEGQPVRVTKFKDVTGAIKRQAAQFRIYEHEGDKYREVAIGQAGIEAITWTVHLANKKPIWFTFSELNGDLEFGEWNSYAKKHVPLNNPDVTDPGKRKALIIDPGPRTLNGPNQREELSREDIPRNYRFGSFPPSGLNPAIDSLGTILTDSAGRLLVLGGYALFEYQSNISTTATAPTWCSRSDPTAISGTRNMIPAASRSGCE